MTYPFGLTVTLISKTASGSKDGLGNTTKTAANSSIPGCVYAPAGSVESFGNDQVVTSQPTLYMPTGTAVDADDEVTIPGYGTFNVDGDPQVWPPHPMTGWRPPNSVVVRLLKVAGA